MVSDMAEQVFVSEKLLCSIMAREALQPFYDLDRNWLEEGLIFEDTGILKWRELGHRHGRGLQLPSHLS
jgi:hypothetical protein